MYQNKVVVALKNNGKVLREIDDTVYIPFGSEYSLFIKNLNTQRCIVSVEIDGQDVGGGNSFVVNAGGSIDIERFIEDGNLSAGQRFKFIERTNKIEQHRGIGAEDGLIRVSFEFEKYVPPINSYFARGINSIHSPYLKSAGRTYEDSQSYNSASSISADLSFASASLGDVAKGANDVGITVGGSISEQEFTAVSPLITDGIKHVMVFELLGEMNQRVVKTPLTVKTKQICPTCGHTNKSNSKFCGDCGTGLLTPA